MAGRLVSEINAKSAAALTRLARQLDGMDPHLDRPSARGEWTAREVLAHLLGDTGWDPLAVLKTFAHRDLPTIDVTVGTVVMTTERRTMTAKQFLDAIERRRQKIVAYLDTLPDGELTGRKARIPFFKQFMGTDEVPLYVYAGALLDNHWNDHAGQLAKIRTANGLPEAP
jgi:Mycothiol maleylpyruvate isomerase N-terminal domain